MVKLPVDDVCGVDVLLLQRFMLCIVVAALETVSVGL